MARIAVQVVRQFIVEILAVKRRHCLALRLVARLEMTFPASGDLLWLDALHDSRVKTSLRSDVT